MQRGDAWAPVAGRVAPRYRPVLVDFGEPTLDAGIEAIARAGRGGAVVAYSMGGRIALHAALAHRAAFRALVLVGATPGIEDDRLRRSRRAADQDLAAWMAGERIDKVVAHWEAQPVFASQPPELVAAQRAGRLAHDPRLLARMLTATGQGTLPSLWPRLSDIAAPVLAVAGEHDEKYAEVAERMAAGIPRGRAAILPGAGHAAHLEQPEAFADLLLAFLDEHLG
jgi:2-succinyl-6-hydroxy-2,4-cyclohexadiene-1-carboxylate synthase